MSMQSCLLIGQWNLWWGVTLAGGYTGGSKTDAVDIASVA